MWEEMEEVQEWNLRIRAGGMKLGGEGQIISRFAGNIREFKLF